MSRLPSTHVHYGVHMTHCGPLNDGVCKYGEDDICPALTPNHSGIVPEDELVEDDSPITPLDRLTNISRWFLQRDYKATPVMLALIAQDMDEQVEALTRTQADLTRERDELKAELARRDANETRNCINWAPCSAYDGRMPRGE